MVPGSFRRKERKSAMWRGSGKVNNPKLLIATPCGANVPFQYVDSITTTILKLANKYNIGVGLIESPLIYLNRNKLFARAYQDKVDYLLFVDSDMDWTPDMVDRLVEFDKDVACGLFFSRKPMIGDTHVPMVMFRSGDEYKAYNEVPPEPMQVDGCGMAFTMIKGAVIEKMTKMIPELGLPFDHLSVDEIGLKPIGSRIIGEDMSFCHRAKKAGFEIWCNPDVRVGHLVVTSLGKP